MIQHERNDQLFNLLLFHFEGLIQLELDWSCLNHLSFSLTYTGESYASHFRTMNMVSC